MSTGAKRKSDAGAGGSAKKARASNAHASAIASVSDILANPDTFPISEDEAETRKVLVELAKYANALEEQVSAKQAAASAPVVKQKTEAELEAAAEKLRKAAVSGIKKQMSWKPSCKTGGAKWVYDGICSDPAVFGHLMGLGGPPKFKMKKFTNEEFSNCIDYITAHCRYNDLRITSPEITVRWSDSGEFKFSGTYGI